MGCPYNAVGMQRASHSAIGLPSSSTSAFSMLAFLMPADGEKKFHAASESVGVNSFQCPSVTTSTAPSVTLIAL